MFGRLDYTAHLFFLLFLFFQSSIATASVVSSCSLFPLNTYCRQLCLGEFGRLRLTCIVRSLDVNLHTSLPRPCSCMVLWTWKMFFRLIMRRYITICACPRKSTWLVFFFSSNVPSVWLRSVRGGGAELVGNLNTAHIDSAHLCIAQGRSLGVLRRDYDGRITIHAWCGYDGRGLNPHTKRSESIPHIATVYLPPAKVRLSTTHSTAAWRSNVFPTSKIPLASTLWIPMEKAECMIATFAR